MRSWCAMEAYVGSGGPPPAFVATDPLNLAVRAGRADLVALIARHFSQAACPAPRALCHTHLTFTADTVG